MTRLHSHRDSAPRLRNSRRRRAAFTAGVEGLEGRTLLSLTTVSDINTDPLFPAEITNINGNLFYLTRASDGGTNLVMTTGTGSMALKDFNTPSSYAYGSRVSHLTAAGGKLYFVANGGNGEELWVSDGSVQGTRIVKDLNPGPNGSNPGNLTAVGSKLFFTASNVPGMTATGGADLFETDGTAGGTIPVPNPAGVATGILGASDLVAYQGKLFFASGNHLDSATGAVGGTSVIAGFTLSGGGATTAPGHLTVAGSSLFFVNEDPTGNPALWKTNGTVAGTTILQSFTPPSSANPFAYQPVLTNLTAVGSNLFFAANDSANGPALWMYNATSSTTTLLKNLPQTASNYFSASSSPIGNPTAVKSQLFFTTADGAGPTGIELWVSNGTAGGTNQVADISPAVQDYSPTIVPGQFAAYQGNLYFANADSAHGVELWKSNGTIGGTFRLNDINAGVGSSFPGHLAVSNGVIYFSASDGAGGNQLWLTNGTTAGTTKWRTMAASATASALADGFSGGTNSAVTGSLMLFSAEDGVHGNELWRTDGSTGGTVFLKDLESGPLSSAPSNFKAVNGKIFFTTRSPNGGKLWVSDGTAAGTVPLMALTATVFNLAPIPFKGGVVFTETTTTNGTTVSELWESNGTVAGTIKLRSFTLASPYSYGANGMTAYNGRLYFSAPDGSGNNVMWVSDGTPDGTTEFDSTANITNPEGFKLFKGKLAFTAKNGSADPALWLTDGTNGGTSAVAPLGNVTQPSILTVAGSTVFFFVPTNGPLGASSILWKSNGTAAGTVQVSNLSTFYVPEPAAVGLPNGKVVFEVGSKATPTSPIQFHPWVSDGTAAGTKLLKDIQADLIYSPARVINGFLYFSGADASRGEELWRTDGTTNGTIITQNVAPGAFPSFPSPLASLNGNLIAVANNRFSGFELLTNGDPGAAKPPTLVPIPDQTATVGVTTTIMVKGIDSNPGRRLVYSLAPGSPVLASIDPNTGVITWKPGKPQITKLTVNVNDTGNMSLYATTSFTVSVT